MLATYFDTGSRHIQHTKIGGSVVYGLVEDKARNAGIFPGGLEPDHDGDFFTVFVGDTMCERIETEMKACADSGTASRYYRVCEPLSNAYLHTCRHEASWYAGDLLTGAYKIGKDHELDGDLKGTEDGMHICVWTDQNGHKKPPHLCIAPHKAIPSGMDCSHYIGGDELFNSIQVGTCLKKAVEAHDHFAGDGLASHLQGLFFHIPVPKFKGEGQQKRLVALIGAQAHGGAVAARVSARLLALGRENFTSPHARVSPRRRL